MEFAFQVQKDRLDEKLFVNEGNYNFEEESVSSSESENEEETVETELTVTETEEIVDGSKVIKREIVEHTKTTHWRDLHHHHSTKSTSSLEFEQDDLNEIDLESLSIEERAKVLKTRAVRLAQLRLENGETVDSPSTHLKIFQKVEDETSSSDSEVDEEVIDVERRIIEIEKVVNGQIVIEREVTECTKVSHVHDTHHREAHQNHRETELNSTVQ